MLRLARKSCSKGRVCVAERVGCFGSRSECRNSLPFYKAACRASKSFLLCMLGVKFMLHSHGSALTQQQKSWRTTACPATTPRLRLRISLANWNIRNSVFAKNSKFCFAENKPGFCPADKKSLDSDEDLVPVQKVNMPLLWVLCQFFFRNGIEQIRVTNMKTCTVAVDGQTSDGHFFCQARIQNLVLVCPSQQRKHENCVRHGGYSCGTSQLSENINIFKACWRRTLLIFVHVHLSRSRFPFPVPWVSTTALLCVIPWLLPFTTMRQGLMLNLSKRCCRTGLRWGCHFHLQTNVTDVFGALVDADNSCEIECTGDSECRGLRKCCVNGCGTSCVMPEFKGNKASRPSMHGRVRVVISLWFDQG